MDSFDLIDSFAVELLRDLTKPRPLDGFSSVKLFGA
jgi:hypothetical protein